MIAYIGFTNYFATGEFLHLLRQKCASNSKEKCDILLEKQDKTCPYASFSTPRQFVCILHAFKLKEN